MLTTFNSPVTEGNIHTVICNDINSVVKLKQGRSWQFPSRMSGLYLPVADCYKPFRLTADCGHARFWHPYGNATSENEVVMPGHRFWSLVYVLNTVCFSEMFFFLCIFFTHPWIIPGLRPTRRRSRTGACHIEALPGADDQNLASLVQGFFQSAVNSFVSLTAFCLARQHGHTAKVHLVEFFRFYHFSFRWVHATCS